ncbi:RloA protein [Kribbella flavida DSM 17836]|uniref:RloA protein n=1 Tax=Kribbella flavida (strain DSM 17836 / JCM 10339 / NBRC 14399) TaxID=479435 RepID=D2PMG9_KRIFD|nr:ATP-binding protein [Kribbella flavida]ADB30713.1 RloA protein [Kribbella flavida DSM 17836]
MLIRAEFANFRSILEPVELSLVAVDTERPTARDMPNLGASLLHVAAIYGPNASGKSNIIAGLTWLRDAVGTSLQTWSDGIPLEPFAFANGPQQSSTFTLELAVGGVRFEYVLELDRQAVGYEALFHYPEKKRKRILEREGNELKLQRGLGHLSGMRKLLSERSLALSGAWLFGDPLVDAFTRELSNIQSLGLSHHGRRPPANDRHSTADLFNEPEPEQASLFTLDDLDPSRAEDRSQALAMLRLADLGIADVMVVDDPEAIPKGNLTGRRRRERLQLMHNTSQGPVALDFSAESEGTRTWFRLIGPVLFALRQGSVLLFDELDASLHPTLSGQLISLFQDPATNPRDAQLIFTTHDTSLLNHLNRDEVWLTEKSDSGATRLGALAEFAGERVRASVNLEKAYLHGRFGALPDTDRTELLRVLGLIG